MDSCRLQLAISNQIGFGNASIQSAQLIPSSSSILDETPLAGRYHRSWQLARNWPSFLNDSVAQEHSNNILVVIKQAVLVYVRKIPDKTELLLLESCLYQYLSRFGSG
jgi:hypothetical protein